MADPAKLMEMLHPMREPPLPDSVVPALVMLAAGCLGAAVLAGFAWRLYHHASGRRTSALRALAATRALNPADRLAAQAALLRRMAHVLGREEAMHEQGGAWLASLDHCFRTNFFSTGLGTAYGDALYRRGPAADVAALDRALAELFARLRPPSKRKAGG